MSSKHQHMCCAAEEEELHVFKGSGSNWQGSNSESRCQWALTCDPLCLHQLATSQDQLHAAAHSRLSSRQAARCRAPGSQSSRLGKAYVPPETPRSNTVGNLRLRKDPAASRQHSAARPRAGRGRGAERAYQKPVLLQKCCRGRSTRRTSTDTTYAAEPAPACRSSQRSSAMARRGAGDSPASLAPAIDARRTRRREPEPAHGTEGWAAPASWGSRRAWSGRGELSSGSAAQVTRVAMLPSENRAYRIRVVVLA